MSIPDLKLLGVVLCGGGSKRMGRDKAELSTPDGRSFLQLACLRLQAHCDTVCVSSSRRRETSCQQISDPPDSHGPISGIYASLTHAIDQSFDACVFNPVDTPYLTSRDVETLVDAFGENHDKIVCAVSNQSAVPAENIEPLIAIYPVAFASLVGDSIDRGQYSLRRLLDSLPIVLVPLAAQSCRNINTPSDLEP